MPSINYRIWFDKQWFYIADVDPKGMSKKQVKEIQNLTQIVETYTKILNVEGEGGNNEGKKQNK